MKKELFTRRTLASVGISALLLLTSIGIASAASISSELSLGSTGPDVTTLQTFLAASPSIYPSGLITGYYGPLTQAAVAQFQTTNGLEAVGNVGPLTLAMINQMLLNGIGMDMTAPSISNVFVSSNSNSATVSWTTNENTRSKIFYNTAPMATTEADAPMTEPIVNGTVMADGTYKTSETMSITGLQSDTTYYYRVESIDASGNVSISNEMTFTTTN